MANRGQQIKSLLARAQDGERIVIVGGRKDKKTGAPKDQTIWGGLGNRSGLHSYAYTLIREKWEKSGLRFAKKLNSLPAGTKLAVQSFQNVNRDRGRWVSVRTIVLGEVAR